MTAVAVDPGDRRMVDVHVCWHCYGGAHERCCYYGYVDPRRSPGLLVDCRCARIRHPASMADGGKSTQLYDAAGAEVFPWPATADAPGCEGCDQILRSAGPVDLATASHLAAVMERTHRDGHTEYVPPGPPPAPEH